MGKVGEIMIATALALLVSAGPPAAADAVRESARQIPVAYDVDVVVVGGASGAVAAAVAAAQAGASVFLAAPRTYLGEDICGAYRLWLEPDDRLTTDLAEAIFLAEEAVPSGYDFAYRADLPPASPHRDTEPPSRLADGRFHDSVHQSVQYNGSATVRADLGSVRDVRRVHVLVYQRRAEFEVARVRVSVSRDGEEWERTAVIENKLLGEGDFEHPALRLSAQVPARARYLRFRFEKAPDAERILIGEIVIEGPGAVPARTPPRPMHVKRTLDHALLENGVEFLYSCYPTDVLRDESGGLAGIVMANFAGRQAVRAGVIVDATPRATVARMAGVEFTPYPAGAQTFTRVVVGKGLEPDLEDPGQGALPAPVDGQMAVEHTLTIEMPDGSLASFAEAQQVARDRTWHPAQTDAAGQLFQVPPDRMVASSDGPSGEADVAALRPEGTEGLYVLGGCAAVDRGTAADLLRPPAYMELGRRVGTAAAEQAAARRLKGSARVVGGTGKTVAEGDVREFLSGYRQMDAEDAETVASAERPVPVLGEYDVVVVGGGTGGAPAGIAAAREGARTLVVEYLYQLGGVATAGMIGRYYGGYRKGFTAEVDAGVAALEGASPLERKAEWWRRELRRAGADIWMGCIGCGAFVNRGRVRGVVVATPQGRGVVLADVVIDSTGKADVAAAAGAECLYTDGSHVAVQGTGLPPRRPGDNYANTDWTISDDTDMLDVWRSFIQAREKFSGAYDLAQIVDTRERRRIVGDVVISPLDILLGRHFPDTVAIGRSNFDSHGYTIHPRFTIAPPDKSGMTARIPLRALVPRGLHGILVTGLGISAHRDAMPILRMQPDIQNEGYAAGLAAAMASRAGLGPREIDIEALQEQLRELEILPECAVEGTASFPRPAEDVRRAVERVVEDYKGIDVILAQPADALPMLQQAFEQAEDPEAALVYARILAMLGDPSGAGVLADEVRRRPWDDGWNYRGMGQYGASLSPLDSLIIALGRTDSPEALPPILEKVERLDADKDFSHHRAVAEALESLGDPAAAGPLAGLLNKDGMSGHAWTHIDEAAESAKSGGRNDVGPRRRALRELILARALYRCGDHEGTGRATLQEYARDLRGHLARHARAVLRDNGRGR